MTEPWTLAVVVLAGTLGGACTGLLPGLHVNTLAPLLLASAVFLDPLAAVLLILSVATSHTIVNVVPTLAAPLPEDDTSLVLLPIQRLARAGHAGPALLASVRASWAAGALAAILGLLFLLLPIPFDGIPNAWTRTGVLGIVLLLILGTRRPGHAALLFLFAGAAGIILLPHSIPGPLGGDGSVLLPAFAAFFGTPLLVMALAGPPTGDDPTPDATGAMENPGFLPTLLGTGCGLLVSLFPGLTSATAGAFGRAVRSPDNDIEDVAMVSAVNTANAMGNTVMMVLLGATRSGANAAAARLDPEIGGIGASTAAAALVAGLLVTTALSALLVLRTGPRLVGVLRRLPPRGLAAGGLGLLATIVFLANGPFGLLLVLFLLPLGFLPHHWSVPRALLMGFLLVPYLFAA
ncbi:MAG: tripartite tricarboxylate transporter permease [Euryarchaeota archaeon]|nr:tripartite tricarboxylate transporter permease [Euryarchaeota archaeon]